MSKVLDKVLTSTPVDGTAGRVVGKGVEYKCPKKVLTADSPNPIPTQTTAPWADDLTGMRRGRLTVIGLARFVQKRWVVRCDCGTYTLRTAKAIKNENNVQDRCEECRHLAHLKRKDHFRRTGKDTDIREY